MASPFMLRPETRGSINSASSTPPSFGRASVPLAAVSPKIRLQPGDVTAMPALKAQDCGGTGGTVDDARVKKEWSGLYWDREIVGRILSQSSVTKVLRLKYSDPKPTTAHVAIHEGLLLHFSPKFPTLAVAVAASSATSTLGDQTTFEVDTTSRVLEMLITWVYTGDLASSRELTLSHADLIELYIFAKRYEFIVLQRYALDQIFRVMTRRSHVLDSHFATDFPRELPGTKEVRRAFDTLAHGSRLQQWLIEVYVHHYSPSKSTYNAKDWSGLPSEFLSEVMHGKARLLEQSKERSTGFARLSPGNASPEKCPCCTNLCDFHEHVSELERQAVCGGNNSAELREEIFSANFGEAQQISVKKETVV